MGLTQRRTVLEENSVRGEKQEDGWFPIRSDSPTYPCVPPAASAEFRNPKTKAEPSQAEPSRVKRSNREGKTQFSSWTWVVRGKNKGGGAGSQYFSRDESPVEKEREKGQKKKRTRNAPRPFL